MSFELEKIVVLVERDIAAKPRRARPAPQGGRVPHPPSGREHRYRCAGRQTS